MKIGAAILAGGRATRMGGAEKSLLTVGGRRIVDRQIAALQQATRELLIVARDPKPFHGLPARVISDRRPGLGPLAGLEAALLETDCDALILVAGDMPALSPRVLQFLAASDEKFDVVIPIVAARAEPLHARYHRRILPEVQARLDRNQLAMHALVAALAGFRIEEDQLRALDPTLLTVANVNTPEDLARLATALVPYG